MSPLVSAGAIVCALGLASTWLYILSSNLPALNDNNGSSNRAAKGLHFPRDLDDLSELADVLKQYKADHFGYITLLFSSAYLYKQTFAIPGSVFMNILGGAIYGIWLAFPLCCFLSAVGASCCFMLSKLFGRALIMRYFSERLEPLQQMVQDNLDGLFFFLLSMRIFPMSPNWFINMAAPILDVPLIQFFFSVLIGLMPYNFVCVQTGSILSEINTIQDVMTTSVMVKFGLVAVVMLIPGILAKKMKNSRTKEG